MKQISIATFIFIFIFPIMGGDIQPFNIQIHSDDLTNAEFGISPDYYYAVDTEMNVPRFVFAEIDIDDLTSPNERTTWKERSSINCLPGGINKLYQKSGYHKGHILGSKNSRFSETTFTFNVAAPQTPRSNIVGWLGVEEDIRDFATIAAQKGESIYFLGGVGFIDDQPVKWLGDEGEGIAIPHFWWVVIRDWSGATKCWVVRNDDNHQKRDGDQYVVTKHYLKSILRWKFIDQILEP